ncbi:hypothetical protein H072_5865 [Dactylellina haptotyla CBS 200.50]|uniref:Nucleoporin Pom152 n=1 Tax=Dactylellina haptotyla (strain CBS 200.50) TaxID=1284197 RepID=S8ABQ5_DACHA|nr:hypothetical protein H072_5865 [Dactylellina haptotyla CBS 200.50]
MDTPRIPASFPKTPTSIRPRGPERPDTTALPPPTARLPPNPKTPDAHSRPKRDGPKPNEPAGPYIPVSVIDAPTQRLYACSVFILLQAYKLYEIGGLYAVDDNSISELWLILKWVAIDGVFLRLLPLLRIPWLTFSTHVTVFQIVFMSMMDIFFCLRYQDTFAMLILSTWKYFFSHELGLSEKRVKVRNIISNNSPILGKHTVHYLPEGSAMLNPSNFNLCFNFATKEGASLPIMINASIPTLIQLSVRNFETPEPLMINITQKEIKRLIKSSTVKPGDPNIHHIQYPIKNPGLYRLEKVIDVSQLVVRVRKAELLIAACPSASFGGGQSVSPVLDKCRGELSDLTLEVVGLPPLQVRYGRSINQDGKDVTIQSISPVGYTSPLVRSQSGDGIQRSLLDKDLTWARSQKISIPLNESLASHGSWTYAVEEVIDGMGNIIKYNPRGPAAEHGLHRNFNVHERPLVRYLSCSPQNPLMVARGKSGALRVAISRDIDAAPYEIEYSFTPNVATQEDVTTSNTEIKKISLKSSGQPITVSSPGLYSLQSISSRFCPGEVLEPSNCLFLTPPDPSLAISYDEIVDRCAGSSIGLTIDMDLTGTPPFKVYYRTIKDKKHSTVNSISVPGTRHQLRLTPSAAGHYTYEFFAINDHVYDGVNLDFKKLSVNQRIIPMAGAVFVPSSASRRCCIGESATFTVDMQGSGPWTLEYELVHAGKRTKVRDANITVTPHIISTPKLVSGGDYALVLTTVQDSHGCRVFLESEARIDVRRQRPSAAFAEINGKRVTNTLEAERVPLPLRLVGERPFRLKYRFTDEQGKFEDHEITAQDFNSHLQASKRGRYQILSVHDAICPGTVAESASIFDISWIPRPYASLVQSPSLIVRGDIYVRNPICEGDQDAVELSLEGQAPFIASFEQSLLGERGESKSLRTIDLKAGTARASLRMDTSKSGIYKYRLRQISDVSYTKPAPPSSPLVIEQTVNARPSARFKTPGKVHKYCLEAGTGDDTIPIILDGVAPFVLSITVKHYSTGKEEIINIPNIDSGNYVFRVPHHALTLGGHIVRIHKVRDSRGCSQKYGIDLPHVSVAVAELPSLTSLDPKPYYCVGDRISYSLAGSPPFTLEYTFSGKRERVSSSSIFQRVAERPGVLTFNSVKDSASDCKVDLDIMKTVYGIPSVRVSEGSQVVEGIHEGEHVEIHFQLEGSPPFTFTYIRTEIPKKGQKPKVLEMHTQTTENYTHTIIASLEGTYEVISIHDKYCGFAAAKSHDYNSKQS